jgi:hypothetical protein
LQPEARRSLSAVAETYRQSVASAQIATADANQERIRVRPDVQSIKPNFELGAVARLDRGEVRHRWLVELRFAHVGRAPPRDLYHASVVDPERAGGVNQCQLGMRARDEWTCRRQLGPPHLFGKIG